MSSDRTKQICLWITIYIYIYIYIYIFQGTQLRPSLHLGVVAMVANFTYFIYIYIYIYKPIMYIHACDLGLRTQRDNGVWWHLVFHQCSHHTKSTLSWIRYIYIYIYISVTNIGHSLILDTAKYIIHICVDVCGEASFRPNHLNMRLPQRSYPWNGNTMILWWKKVPERSLRGHEKIHKILWKNVQL